MKGWRCAGAREPHKARGATRSVPTPSHMKGGCCKEQITLQVAEGFGGALHAGAALPRQREEGAGRRSSMALPHRCTEAACVARGGEARGEGEGGTAALAGRQWRQLLHAARPRQPKRRRPARTRRSPRAPSAPAHRGPPSRYYSAARRRRGAIYRNASAPGGSTTMLVTKRSRSAQ